MEEIWCDISDYKRLYQVSTLGRVRSLDRIIYDQGSVSNCSRGKVKQVKGYIYKYLEEHKNESN